MNRLPQLPQSTDSGTIYVIERAGKYKIGFTRGNLRRQSRGLPIVAVIPTGQRPSQLEYAINRRFASKRLPPQGRMPGDKREWFALDDNDLAWLKGLAAHCSNLRQ